MSSDSRTTDFTIDDWCHHRNVSRPQYYRMAARGEAPQHHYIGTHRRISVEADREWLRKKEAEAKEKDRIEYARKVNAPVERG